jgi:hypothetical protein
MPSNFTTEVIIQGTQWGMGYGIWGIGYEIWDMGYEMEVWGMGGQAPF